MGERHVAVVIVGSGYTDLSCALALRDGHSVAVLERETASERGRRPREGDAFAEEADAARPARQGDVHRFVTDVWPDVFSGIWLIVAGVVLQVIVTFLSRRGQRWMAGWVLGRAPLRYGAHHVRIRAISMQAYNPVNPSIRPSRYPRGSVCRTATPELCEALRELLPPRENALGRSAAEGIFLRPTRGEFLPIGP
ncbi:MAG TPA: FAD-dependent oxidoreductase [Myxococcota bacterium]|nr:FAD-dependent oxidoreductase [Myxococcota bacterium]